jgi:hypothetical protein
MLVGDERSFSQEGDRLRLHPGLPQAAVQAHAECILLLIGPSFRRVALCLEIETNHK